MLGFLSENAPTNAPTMPLPHPYLSPIQRRWLASGNEVEIETLAFRTQSALFSRHGTRIPTS